MELRTKTLLTLAVMIALSLPYVGAQGSNDGGSNAANKTAVAGSTFEVLGPGLTGGSDSLTETVLATTIKTSPTADLIFSVTLECALWTTVETVGNDMSESTARVEISVLFDGNEVPIMSGGSDGSVVFCDRTHRQTTTLFDDENATINQYLATRTANAFNWVAPDVGGGEHSVEVVATLSGVATDNAFTQAGIGHRTLIVEATHMPVGATVGSGVDEGSQADSSSPAPAGASGWGFAL